jgi:RsiW-degrading membrane proteinase PrsW (M82 family)
MWMPITSMKNPMWNDRRSVARGLLAADVIAAVLFAGFTYATDKTGQHDIGYLFVLFLVGATYSLIAIVVFALPLLLSFGRLRVINLALSLVAGFFIGAVMAGITEWPGNGLMEVIRLNFSDHAVRRIWVFAAIGFASALGFWIVKKTVRLRVWGNQSPLGCHAAAVNLLAASSGDLDIVVLASESRTFKGSMR